MSAHVEIMVFARDDCRSCSRGRSANSKRDRNETVFYDIILIFMLGAVIQTYLEDDRIGATWRLRAYTISVL